MSRTPDQIMTELLALPPDGWALPHDPDTYFAARMRPIAVEFALVEGQMEAFEGDLDPGTAQFLLPDYLRVLGPDPYGRDALPLNQAQVAQLAHQRWTTAPIVCAGYYVQVAAELGIPIIVTECPLPMCGEMQCGHELVPWLEHCVFTVTLPVDDVWDAVCGEAVCGDPLGGFTPSVLEPFIRGTIPLYARSAFSYV